MGDVISLLFLASFDCGALLLADAEGVLRCLRSELRRGITTQAASGLRGGVYDHHLRTTATSPSHVAAENMDVYRTKKEENGVILRP